jgi:hypothetical protein
MIPNQLRYIFAFLLLCSACQWDSGQQQDQNANTMRDLRPSTPAVSQQDWVCIPGKKVGPISLETTEQDLIALFGATNVKREQLSLEEGVIVEGTIVFPDAPNQLIIEWVPGQLYQKPAMIRIEGEQSQWITDQGIHVGSTMDELLQINGQAIQFMGFEWDYSGLVESWGENGKVNKDLIVFFAPANPEAIYPELLGEESFSSEHPKVKAAQLYVNSMMIPLSKEHPEY